jgi:hypothetical protein
VIEREVLVKAEQGAPDSAFVQITGFQIETSTGTRELSSRQLGRFLRCAHHRVEPPGLAVIGQRFYGESGPSLLRIRLNVQLPFGIAVREDLERPSAALNVALINYHCNFGFAKGWRGAITCTMASRRDRLLPSDHSGSDLTSKEAE